MKGKSVCLAQEQKFVKSKGAKKGKQKSKEEETPAVDSPEYHLFDCSKHKQKQEEAAAWTHTFSEEQPQESKSEERIEGLGPKKPRSEEAKEKGEEKNKAKDQGPVNLQPLFQGS